MQTRNYIVKKYCKVSGNAVLVDGKLRFESPKTSFGQFADAAYKQLNISYSKFHKMDNLSKLGFLSAEFLLEGVPLKERYDAGRIGVILSNRSSSLDTDIKYYDMVKKGVASPAVFVYTLPNILIGEICIRHGIKGENSFFVSDKYDISANVNYVNSLFDSGVMDACLCGWIELLNDSYEAFVYLVEKGNNTASSAHSIARVENIYQ